MGVSVTRIVKYILKGDKGDSAVNYYITLSAKTFAADSTGKPLNTTENISVTAYKQVGNNSAVALSTANGDNWYIAAYIRKNESNVSNYVSSNNDNLYIPAPGYAFNEIGVTFSVTINGTPQVYQQEIIQPLKQGAQGSVGAALRGPQAWSDCATGYSFQAGGQGDTWKDVVLYGDNYYSCVKNHTKTATNYPGSTEDSNNGYWQLGDKIELVATKILLATYALVKNLGVEAIDMKDNNGNVLFQAKNGNVICKTGTFENINVTGTINSVSGKIGNFSIDNKGFYYGDPTQWTTSTYKQDLASIIPGCIHIQKQIGCFQPGDIANIKVGIGDGADPSVNPTGSSFCTSAGYFYRQMNSSTDPYFPAVRIISDNVVNRNIALETIGGIRAKKGMIDMGRLMYVGDNNAVNVIDLSFGTSIVIKNTMSGFSFFLPTLSQVRAQLGITSSDPFCIPIRIGIDKSSQYGIYLKTQNKANPPASNAEGGMIVDNDGNEWGSSNISMANGDVLRLSLTYTVYSGYYAQLDTWMN